MIKWVAKYLIAKRVKHKVEQQAKTLKERHNNLNHCNASGCNSVDCGPEHTKGDF